MERGPVSTVLVFPGQGSQAVGMGKPLYESNSEAKQWMDSADTLLGYSLTKIMFEGPDDELARTMYTQPALYVHSVAVLKAVAPTFTAVAGHSLGEFSAMAAAGVFSFEDGLQIVAKRGELMQQAGTAAPGAMAAVIGMADDIVERTCEEATKETGAVVVPANYNSPGQLVISGAEPAVLRAMEMLTAAGCKLVKKLNVSGAFHSPLMQPAYEEFKKFLAPFHFNTPRVPVYQNVTARAELTPLAIKTYLMEQLINPVRWTQSLVQMQADGLNNFVEAGSGKVLQGLVKRTLTGVTISGIQ